MNNYEQLILIEKFYRAMLPSFEALDLPNDFYWDNKKGLLYKKNSIYIAPAFIKQFAVENAHKAIEKSLSDESIPEYKNQCLDRLIKDNINIEDFKDKSHPFHYVYCLYKENKQKSIDKVDPLVEAFCKYTNIPEEEKKYIRNQPNMRERIEFLFETLGYSIKDIEDRLKNDQPI